MVEAGDGVDIQLQTSFEILFFKVFLFIIIEKSKKQIEIISCTIPIIISTIRIVRKS